MDRRPDRTRARRRSFAASFDSLEARRHLAATRASAPRLTTLSHETDLFAVAKSFGKASVAGASHAIAASAATAFNVDWSSVRETLADLPTARAVARRAATAPVIALPSPDGDLQRFRIEPSDVMSPELAAQLPGVKTFRGIGVDDPSATIALDYTPLGLHASVLTRSGNGSWYIDPYFLDDANAAHMSYWRKDLSRSGRSSPLASDRYIGDAAHDVPGVAAGSATASTANGTTLRTYRLAVAATAEYTDYHTPGTGTPIATYGQAAIVTAIARVNQVYESELAIHFTLVANNLSLVFTNAATDPYTNDDGEAMLDQNQARIDSVIKSANYDLGHVFSTGGGGIAGLGVLGIAGEKAQGVTGSDAPINDAFVIDYVVHELGHELGAEHTFNTSKDENRNASTAYEPGSGSSIMAYAGLEDTDDLQPHSDPYFHSQSLDEISALIGSRTNVGTWTSTGNLVPSVSAGDTYVIPANTPFALTAAASDPDDSGTLTYDWQERDLGAARTLTQADNGSSPLFRVYAPSTSPTRTFPQLTSILAGRTTTAAPSGGGAVERLPTMARTQMKFRVIARDGATNGGAFATADTYLRVVNTGAAFAITNFNSATTIAGGSLQTITWAVAGTTASPINATNVNILLSTDGGNTFSTTLAANTPNDGSQQVQMPYGLGSTQVRLKVVPTNNVFFDINNASLTLTKVVLSSATPAAPVLLSSSDSGVSDRDRITCYNNSSPSAALTFTVDDTAAGALVELIADGAVVGSAIATGSSTQITIDAGLTLSDGPASLTARQTEAGKPVSASSAATSITIDTTPPTTANGITPAFEFRYETNQQLQFNFNEPVVSLEPETAILVYNYTTRELVTPTVAYGDATATARFSTTLADGRYGAGLNGFIDLAGNDLPAVEQPFFVLAGDADRSGTVNFGDLLTLAKNYGQSGRTFSAGNFDYSADGAVTFSDLLILAKRYGTSLPTASAATIGGSDSPSPTATRRRNIADVGI